MLCDVDDEVILSQSFHVRQLYNPQGCRIRKHMQSLIDIEEMHMNKRNVYLITACAILALLVYTLDLFKLNYRLTDWSEFGDTPVAISHIQYFVADTPNVLGYTDHVLEEQVTCTEAVAFVETNDSETYRCCDTRDEISCIEGDFSSDIPPVDEECIAELTSIFGVPASLVNAKEYQFYGSCSGSRFAELTVVQLDNNGKIQWKHVEVDPIQITTSVLRCVLGPILLLIILWVVYGIYQRKNAEPVRRF